jgi:hypothetical protein
MPIGHKLTMEDMHKVAKDRGGKCLSRVYQSVKTRMLWECSEGHQWWAVPNDIRDGHWCTHCAKRGKTKGATWKRL